MAARDDSAGPGPAAKPPPAKSPGPCHHELCGCDAGSVRQDGNAYCSVECASPEARTADECRCGHAPCKREGRRRERATNEGMPPPPPLVPPVLL